jgi:hypothetical protein
MDHMTFVITSLQTLLKLAVPIILPYGVPLNPAILSSKDIRTVMKDLDLYQRNSPQVVPSVSDATRLVIKRLIPIVVPIKIRRLAHHVTGSCVKREQS